MQAPDLANLYRLKVFVEVADLQSFSHAARRLFLSQPAVSRHIKELETALGLPVFERRGRERLNLTEAGQAVYRHAKGIIEKVEEMESEASGLAGHVGGLIRVGGSNAWEPLLPGLMAEFQRRHPEVGSRISFGDSERIAGLLLQSQIGLGFVTLAPRDARIEVVPLGESEIVLVVRPDHRLADRASIEPQEIADEPFVAQLSLASTTGNRFLAQHGVIPREVMEVDSLEGVKNAVENGLGVALMSKLGALRELDAGRLATLHFVTTPPRVSLLAIRMRAKFTSPTHEALLEHVRTRIRELDPESSA